MEINKETLKQYIENGGNVTQLAQGLVNKIAPMIAAKFPEIAETQPQMIGQMAKDYVKATFETIVYDGLAL